MSVQKPLVGFAGLSSLVSQIQDQQVKEPLDSENTDRSSRFKWEKTDSKNTQTEANTSTTPKKEQIAPIAPELTPSGPKTSTIIGFMVAVGLFLVWAVSENKPKTSPSFPTYTPPPATARNPPSPPTLPALPAVPPPTYAETAPAPGDGTRILNRENIRWCLYQDRRIEIIRSIILNSQRPGDASSFNAIIDDVNNRCGKYRYYKNDMASVNAELATKESDLQSQAVRIVSDWPHRQSALSPKQPEPPLQPSNSVNPAPPTSSYIEVPQARPSSVPTDNVVVEVQALDLLQMQDATTVQQRLVELGFLGVPPNGIWGPRSRQALREFKLVNGLPRDDAWDQLTNKQLFSLNAQKKTVAGTATKPPGPTQDLDTNYSPPPGTALNPLNRGDAINLQQRLAELGYFVGKSDGLWGLASRDALRKFKIATGLPADDQWNSETETALKNGQPGRTNESFVGGWAGTIAECENSQTGSAPLQITARRAEIGDTVCNFELPQREGLGWRTQAICSEPGKVAWKSNVKISVSGDRLTWSSESGVVSFVRCQGG